MFTNLVAADQTEKMAMMTIGDTAGRMIFTGWNYHAVLWTWVRGEGWKFVDEFYGPRDDAASWLTGKLLPAAAC